MFLDDVAVLFADAALEVELKCWDDCAKVLWVRLEWEMVVNFRLAVVEVAKEGRTGDPFIM